MTCVRARSAGMGAASPGVEPGDYPHVCLLSDGCGLPVARGSLVPAVAVVARGRDDTEYHRRRRTYQIGCASPGGPVGEARQAGEKAEEVCRDMATAEDLRWQADLPG